MRLLAGQKAPDHSTIARFRTGFLADACENLFYQMVHRLGAMDELSKETVFIDGTKLEACANKYTFVWKKSVGKWEEKMFAKMEDAVQMLNQEYLQSFCISKENRTSDLQSIVDYLKDYCLTNTVVFVHGRGKRKSVHQRYLELFGGFLDRQLLYDLHHSRFGSRNSYSKTDVDATFMHMKDDHMRNAQLKPGYNVQIGVDSEYIVAVDIFQDRNDVWTLVPFLKHMEKHLGFRYLSVTADSGYESEEAYDYLKSQEQIPYIKPQTYEKWKKRSKNGYESDVTVYECADCSGCPYKDKCTKAKGNKRLYVSKNFIVQRQTSYENIMSETGIKYRMNRSIQVEGIFGVLKSDYDFQRFLLRGKTKVKLEILLLCFGYNINKLHTKIQNDRLGSHLFPLKTA